MTFRIPRLRRIRTAFTVIAMLLAGLSFSVSPASAYSNAIGGWELQNQATGLCIQGTADYVAQNVTAHDCGTDDNQFLANSTSQIVDLAGGAVSICLAADTYGNALTVDCTNSNYGMDWKYASLRGEKPLSYRT